MTDFKTEYKVMPLKEMLSYVKEAEDRKVSEVARSNVGFVGQYKKYKTFDKLPLFWKKKREGFIKRFLKVREKYPTRRVDLALIMWAYNPNDPDNLVGGARTNPKLWEKAKKQALKKYSKNGRWNAIVAMQAVRLYKKMGGKYTTPKRDNSLIEWMEQRWIYHPSDKKETGRFLPVAVWEQLTPAQVRITNKNKRDNKNLPKVPWEPFVVKAYRNIINK